MSTIQQFTQDDNSFRTHPRGWQQPTGEKSATATQPLKKTSTLRTKSTQNDSIPDDNLSQKSCFKGSREDQRKPMTSKRH